MNPARNPTKSSAHVTTLSRKTDVATTTTIAGMKSGHSRRRSVQPAITANGAATRVRMFPTGTTRVDISITSGRGGTGGLGEITL